MLAAAGPRDASFRGSVTEVGTFPTADLALTAPVGLTAGATGVDLERSS